MASVWSTADFLSNEITSLYYYCFLVYGHHLTFMNYRFQHLENIFKLRIKYYEEERNKSSRAPFAANSTFWN